MKIEWRSKAHQDALGIVDYTDIANPIAAFAVYEEIQDQIGFLSKILTWVDQCVCLERVN